MTAASAMVALQKVSKSFGHIRAVDAVDLAIREGEAVTLLGPNGAGKTTLLRMIAGLTRPTGGALFIAGEEVTHDHHDAIRRKIGYISHQSLTYAELTARENLLFFARLYGVTDPEEKSARFLDEVGLSSRGDDLAGTFSRGMKQRLSIARALVHDPEIILLDEPFSGLDQHAAQTLKKTFERLKEENRTIIMVTHNMPVGLSLSDRVVVQAAGRLVIDEPSAGLDEIAFRDRYFASVGEAHY